MLGEAEGARAGSRVKRKARRRLPGANPCRQTGRRLLSAEAREGESDPGKGETPEGALLRVFRAFHDDEEDGGAAVQIPMFNKEPLDIYKLWKEVQVRGGSVEVSNNKLWAAVGRTLDPPKTMTNLSTVIRKFYEKVFPPAFEEVFQGQFLEQVDNRIGGDGVDDHGTEEASQDTSLVPGSMLEQLDNCDANGKQTERYGGHSTEKTVEPPPLVGRMPSTQGQLKDPQDVKYVKESGLKGAQRVENRVPGNKLKKVEHWRGSRPRELAKRSAPETDPTEPGTGRAVKIGKGNSAVLPSECQDHVGEMAGISRNDFLEQTKDHRKSRKSNGQAEVPNAEHDNWPAGPSMSTAGKESASKGDGKGDLQDMEDGDMQGKRISLKAIHDSPEHAQESAEDWATKSRTHDLSFPPAPPGRSEQPPVTENAATSRQGNATVNATTRPGTKLGSAQRHRARNYKVKRVKESPTGYEIFMVLGGYTVEDIKISCLDDGRLLVRGKVQDEKTAELWGIKPLNEEIKLGRKVSSKSARAVMTLHGLLYIRVNDE
eukprot:evm.model.scf_577EXC.3 EVM.evm.TU.scf_577EXC.3   scf_577EXC:6951-12473(-)